MDAAQLDCGGSGAGLADSEGRGGGLSDYVGGSVGQLDSEGVGLADSEGVGQADSKGAVAGQLDSGKGKGRRGLCLCVFRCCS